MRTQRRTIVSQPTYRYKIGKYAGISNNPKRRAGEHRRAGRRGTMVIVGKPVSRTKALEWERLQKVTLAKRNRKRR